MQGGTIPQNREQSVTFYNTTGVIEKDKNIYLAPRFKTMTNVIGMEVRTAWLQALNEVCPPSSAYEGINVSTWSPQDRTLVVRGNIDDFRLVTEEGDCLNYFIITRRITKDNVVREYYYGFFITGVEQAGGSSIRITATPDDFTNVFYLHNNHVLTGYDVVNTEYEPFNERMKNCYVNRQHYNRIVKSISGYWLLYIELHGVDRMAEGTIQEGHNIRLELDNGGNELVIEGEVNYVDDRDINNGDLILEIKTDQEYQINPPTNWSEIMYEDAWYQCDYDSNTIEWEHVAPVSPANQTIFLNQDESFKFKYQYRDRRQPFSMGELFDLGELYTINTTDNFNNLTADLRKKIIKACMQYLVIETKSTEKTGKSTIYVRDQQTNPYAKLKTNFKNYIEGVYRSSQLLFVPIWNVGESFKKYETDIKSFSFRYQIANLYVFAPVTTASDVYEYLNLNALADFVYSAYITDDICLPNEFLDINAQTKQVTFICQTGLFETSQKGLYVVGVETNNRSAQGYTEYEGLEYIFNTFLDYQANNPAEVDVTTYGFTMLMLSGYNSRSINLTFSDDLDNLQNRYYDPVLEAEPYTFYSLSYLTYEMPFNKNRYFETMNIDIDYTLSINGAIKIGYIPTYQLETYKFKYYNEGLVFTLPSNMPLMSDSYASYYYQNQAQMKNQFAVNDYNRGVDLAQHFFLSGPNAVGNMAFKRGGYGAIAETINQFAQMGDEMIDWAQSNKEIEMNQKAKLADMGAKPDVVKQTGSDVFFDLTTRENRPYLNHYTIDSPSYYSIAKYLERYGYQYPYYTTLNTMNRVGWNFIKLISFDWSPSFDIMVEQEESIKKIFMDGVTLLHDKYYLTAGHNYETILDE